jgi:hypothetical protein
LNKKFLLLGLFLLAAAAAFSQKAITLTAALKESSNHFLNEIPENSTVAVIEFTSDSQDVSDYIDSNFSRNIMENDKRIILVDRTNLQKTKQEIDLSLNMDVSEETALRIGQLVSARFIIFGSIKEMGKVYFLQIRGMEVETSRTLKIYTQNIQKKDYDKLFSKQDGEKPLNKNMLLPWLPHSISAGTTLATPLFVLSIYNNKGFGDYIFLNYGCDLGFIHRNPGDIKIEGVTYYSFYPFINIGAHTTGTLRYFLKMGGGFMISNYIYDESNIDDVHVYTPAFNAGGGISFKDIVELDYTLRTNFTNVNHKISVGFTIHY